jgi:beta-lactamase regulating signal transducer with metallopeptidase domain
MSILSILVGATVRGGMLLLFAAMIVRLWPRASAAQRHLVWAVACCSLLLLPILLLVVPVWPVHLFPAAITAMDRIYMPGQHATSIVVDAIVRYTTVATGTATVGPTQEPIWLLLIIVGWGIGTLVMLTVFLENQRRVRNLVAESLPLTDARMLGVLTRVRSDVHIVRQIPVRLHTSTVPMVCGVLRPVVVLPLSSLEWGESRLRHVFLHELAHIKRYDCLVRTFASVACALYWFNPLVWLAVKELQAEQEFACDDAVLATGSWPRDYAMDLLELTQAFRPTSIISLAAFSFAQPSQLQKRLSAIVDRARSRSLVSRWGVMVAWGAGLGIVYPVVGLIPQGSGPVSYAQRERLDRGTSIARRITFILPIDRAYEVNKDDIVYSVACRSDAVIPLSVGATAQQPCRAVESTAEEKAVPIKRYL